MVPPGQPPAMPPGYGGALSTPGNLASPGLRIVGGLIDVVILIVINGLVSVILQKAQGVAGIVNLAVDLAYFGYFWSAHGQTRRARRYCSAAARGPPGR